MKRLAEITGGRVLSWDNPAEVFDRQAASRMRLHDWSYPALAAALRCGSPTSPCGAWLCHGAPSALGWPPCSAGGLHLPARPGVTPASSGWRRAKPAPPSSTAATPRSRRRRPRPRANAAARAGRRGREPRPAAGAAPAGAARPAGGARFAAGECPAREERPAQAKPAASQGARKGSAPTPPRPAAEAGGQRQPAGETGPAPEGSSMDRLLKAKTRHALMCRLTLRPKLSNVRLRPKLLIVE